MISVMFQKLKIVTICADIHFIAKINSGILLNVTYLCMVQVSILIGIKSNLNVKLKSEAIPCFLKSTCLLFVTNTNHQTELWSFCSFLTIMRNFTFVIKPWLNSGVTDLRKYAHSLWASAACSLQLSSVKTLAHSLSVSYAASRAWTTFVLSVSLGLSLPRTCTHSTAPLEYKMHSFNHIYHLQQSVNGFAVSNLNNS